MKHTNFKQRLRCAMPHSLAKSVLPVCLMAALFAPHTPARARSEAATPWTVEEKLYAYSKFWMEARRNFVYMYKVGNERWDSLYRAMLPQVMKSPDDIDFIHLMQRFCAFLEDGHTMIYHDSSHFNRNVTTNYFLNGITLWIKRVEGHPIVVGIDSDHAGEIPLGSEVVAVDSIPADEYLRTNKMPYIPASAPHVRLERATAFMLQALEGTTRDVTFRVGKELKTLRLTNGSGAPYSPAVSLPGLAWCDKRVGFEHTWPRKDIAYIRIGTLNDDKILRRLDEVFPEIRKRAKVVIIDLRNNGGGNSSRGAYIISHFTPKNHLDGSRWFTRCYLPAYASWGGKSPSRPDGLQPQDTVGNEYQKKCYLHAHDLAMYDGGAMTANFAASHPYTEIPVAVLTNSNTASACEDFLIYADQLPNFFQVGEPTNGSTGNPIFIDLIPGLSCQICTKKDTYPDGREFVGKGIEPDILVPVTLESVRQNKDIQLEAALKELGKRIH